MNRTRNADHAARTRERFVYSIVKITRLYDYQTWQTHFWRNSRGAQRFVGFFLDCAFRMLIGWTGEHRSRATLVIIETALLSPYEVHESSLTCDLRFDSVGKLDRGLTLLHDVINREKTSRDAPVDWVLKKTRREALCQLRYK